MLAEQSTKIRSSAGSASAASTRAPAGSWEPARSSGQVVADSIDGRQHSGIGGHEDFTSGGSFEADDRSLICMPSTVEVKGETLSRIHATFSAGTVVTTPRHQLDIVVTEFGAAEVSGLTVRDRAHALAEIAHPEFRADLHDRAEGIG